MKRKLPVIALLALGLAGAGCQRENAPAPVDADKSAETAAASEEAAPVEATTIAESSAADVITAQSKGFDTKAFVGTFAGSDGTLVLRADGNFELAGASGQASDEGKLQGTWTVEKDGKLLRLDPDSKSEGDRLYAIVSNDRIEPLGADGERAATGLDHSLQRGR